jgi:spore maturation protein CgeB
MTRPRLRIVICGLSITSSWGNGHAVTYRGLVRELCARGHDVLFLEADRPWYASHRDLPDPPYGRTELYSTVDEFRDLYTREVEQADVVMVGSYVPDGVAIGNWVVRHARGARVFYDIDTPVTLSKIGRGDLEYLSPGLIPLYDLYLSFTGGPVLRAIERKFGSPKARALYCSADTQKYFPEEHPLRWELGYLGTYSDDRQPTLERLLLAPARERFERRFVVAGPQYPDAIEWPLNLERIEHLAPDEHRRFYNRQRYTLNVTRKDMVLWGYSPSIRLFEAAACGTPIISDWWTGLDALFEVGREILIARDTSDVLRILSTVPEEERTRIGARGRERVLRQHTAARRAAELEYHVLETLSEISKSRSIRRSESWNNFDLKTDCAAP